jgi:hypothetical protein
MEIVVDRHNETETWWGRWNHLDSRLEFPFTAECAVARRGSPLRAGEQVKVEYELTARERRPATGARSARQGHPRDPSDAGYSVRKSGVVPGDVRHASFGLSPPPGKSPHGDEKAIRPSAITSGSPASAASRG